MSYLDKIKKVVKKQPIIICQGAPGSGKSTYASQIPNCLYLGLENIGVTTIENLIPKDTFGCYNDFLSLLIEIRDDSNFKFKCIVIDSLTSLNYLMTQQILKDHPLPSGKLSDNLSDNKNANLNYGQGDRILERMFVQFTDLLNEIRDVHNCRIVLLGHQTTTVLTDNFEEIKVTKQIVDVNKKALNKILANVDIVFGLDREVQTKAMGDSFMGNQKFKAKSEEVVARFNSLNILGKIRSEYFDPEVCKKDGVFVVDGEEYDMTAYPLPNKNEMFTTLEKLLDPALRLSAGSTENTSVKNKENNNSSNSSAEVKPEARKRIADTI